MGFRPQPAPPAAILQPARPLLVEYLFDGLKGFGSGKNVRSGVLRGISPTRAVLSSGAKVLGYELPANLVNSFWGEKFVKCYVRAPERDANNNGPHYPSRASSILQLNEPHHLRQSLSPKMRATL
jgi:hypothetical protein